jgi:hypothetical protein
LNHFPRRGALQRLNRSASEYPRSEDSVFVGFRCDEEMKP